MRRRKLNACQTCYDSRVKCVYTNEQDGVCDRCMKQSRVCTPRIILRGKASQRSKEKWKDNTLVCQKELNALKTYGIFESNAEVAHHYAAAAACVRTYKSLGLEKPPPVLHCFCQFLFIMAAKQKSFSRLHAATTLAVSTGTDVDISSLKIDQFSFTEDNVKLWDQEVEQRFGARKEAGECFVVRHLGGKRAVATTCGFDSLFDPDKKLRATRDDETPHGSFWLPFLTDVKSRDAFSAKMMLEMVKTSTTTQDGRIIWTCCSDEKVSVVDAHGHALEADLYEEGWFAANGQVCYVTFGFKNLRPLPSSKNISEAEKCLSTAISGGRDTVMHWYKLGDDEESDSYASIPDIPSPVRSHQFFSTSSDSLMPTPFDLHAQCHTSNHASQHGFDLHKFMGGGETSQEVEQQQAHDGRSTVPVYWDENFVSFEDATLSNMFGSLVGHFAGLDQEESAHSSPGCD